MASTLPLCINLQKDATILVIGGGHVASGKINVLLPYGKHIHIVSPKIISPLHAVIKEHNLQWTQSEFQLCHLQDAKIVVAATDNAEMNAYIAEQARQKNMLVNVVDQPELCDFFFPAIVRRGDVQIAIGTNGVAPVLARYLKGLIEKTLPVGLSTVAALLKKYKTRIRTVFTDLQPRRQFYMRFLSSVFTSVERSETEIVQQLENQLSQDNVMPQACLYLIGAGCGNPDLLTIQAIRALSEADVILHDRLVSPLILERYARRDALCIAVGKARGHHCQKQDDIHGLIRKYLDQKQIVVRLKGGDVSIFAHSAEEAQIARDMQLPCLLVPGITAASGCAAFAGVPLTERGGARALRLLTLYSRDLEDKNFWDKLRYAQDETLAFYMSAQNIIALCQGMLAVNYPENHPVLAIEQGTTSCQRCYSSTIGRFVADYGDHVFASPCLFLFGDVVRHYRQSAATHNFHTDDQPFFVLEKSINSVV